MDDNPGPQDYDGQQFLVHGARTGTTAGYVK